VEEIDIDEICNDIKKYTFPQGKSLRGPFPYFGGKQRIISWVLSHIPDGEIYCEPFAGAANVLIAIPKGRFKVEVLNDINNDIIDFFRVAQDPEKFKQLIHRIMWTPYARAEHKLAQQIMKGTCFDEIERAWAIFVLLSLTMSGKFDGGWAYCRKNWFNRWPNRIANLLLVHERLINVQFDSVDAVLCMERWDTPDTVFYCDPPYVHDARSDGFYPHEMTLEQHQQLVECLLQLQGKVVLSCYDHEVYEPLAQAGWQKIQKDVGCHAAGKTRESSYIDRRNIPELRRTETLYIKQ
jgi:DNA adenine methylase